jgi:hypothetical protein
MSTAKKFLLLTLLAGLGCGGPPPAAPPANAVITNPTPPEEAADRTPVPPPKTLLVFGRLAKPTELMKVLGGWSGFPLDASVLGELVANAPLGNAVDWSQPMDLGLAFDVNGRSVTPGVGLSVAIRSLDEAKSALATTFKIKPGKAGVFMLEEKGRPDDEGDEDRRFCGLYPANGSPYRLVCSTSMSSLEAMGAYLARTAPRNTYPSDIHVEGTLAPYQPALNEMRGMLPGTVTAFLGLKKSSADLANPAVADLVDFAIDLDKITLDANVSDAQGTATLTASFKSAQSLVARLAVAHPERADTPPPAFWHLPVATDMAYFHRGIDEKELAHPRDLAFEALGRELKDQGATDADKKAITDVISHLFTMMTLPSVFAKGVDWEAVQKSIQNSKAQSKDPKDAKVAMDAKLAVLEQTAGWNLLGVEAPIAKVDALAKEFSAVIARPTVAKWFKASGKKFTALSLRATPAARAASLPKGTLHYELTVTRASEPAPPPAKVANAGAKAEKPVPEKPAKVHVYLVPDGSRTWVALAVDDALAVKTLSKITANDAAASLEKREGLEALHQAKVGAAGFVTMRGYLAGSPLAYAMETRALVDPFAGLRAAPAQGTAPIAFTFTSLAGKDGNAGSMVVTARVPKAAIQDIVISTMGGGARHP